MPLVIGQFMEAIDQKYDVDQIILPSFYADMSKVQA